MSLSLSSMQQTDDKLVSSPADGEHRELLESQQNH